MTSTVRMIDAILQQKNMSRRQLAKAASIPPSSLQSAMERGKNISADMLQKIANALQVPIELLINPERIIAAIKKSPDFLNIMRNSFYNIEEMQGFESLSTQEQDELIMSFLNQNPDIIERFFWGSSSEKETLVSVGEEQLPTDDEILKMNCNAVFSYMEKMTRAAQAVTVKTVKAISEVPENQKKNEPGKK